MENKVLSLLGLARRAGKLELGFDAAASTARNQKARLLLAAEDISEKTFKNLRYEGERAGVPVLRLKTGMKETGQACGIKRAGVLAVTEQGFSEALRNAIEQRPEEKVERSYDD